MLIAAALLTLAVGLAANILRRGARAELRLDVGEHVGSVDPSGGVACGRPRRPILGQLAATELHELEALRGLELGPELRSLEEVAGIDRGRGAGIAVEQGGEPEGEPAPATTASSGISARRIR